MSKLAIHSGVPVVPKGLHRRWPIISQEDKEAVLRVLDRGILAGPHAPEVRALEEEFAHYVGVRHCLATNSGTAALHMAIAADGVGPGDEVITSAFTYIATPLAILHQNAIPVFVDIDPRTFNLDPAKVEERITERTRAIVAVHIHGLPADMVEIQAVASKHGLLLIEDAAQAHGAEYRGQKVGSLGDMGVFSLNVTKNLPCGEGGLFMTNSDAYRERAAMVRFDGEVGSSPEGWTLEHPLDDEKEPVVQTVGWMYLMSEPSAALARSQLKRLEEVNARGCQNAQVLSEHLSKLPGVKPPFVPPDRTHIFHKYRVTLHPEALGLEIEPAVFRDLILQALRAEGVEAVLWQTVPLPGQPLFQRLEGYGKGCPWSCFKGERVYRVEEYPETKRLLDASIVIGSQSYPLFAQPLELMDRYAEAFQKIFSRIGDLLSVGRGRMQ
ncbi:MAG: DegT/DnrJ/EryC1/StrS family aminotransferase [candidate division NC10 bacterium]|nr:DegT/DnrJ/EryC1/StrS family aminotransferase [candidate division NC10 bacterium]